MSAWRLPLDAFRGVEGHLGHPGRDQPDEREADEQERRPSTRCRRNGRRSGRTLGTSSTVGLGVADDRLVAIGRELGDDAGQQEVVGPVDGEDARGPRPPGRAGERLGQLDHLVGDRRRARPAGDGDHRRVGRVLRDAPEDPLLERGVDGGEGVVEHQHAGRGHEGAGEREALALAAGHREAAIAEHGVEPVRAAPPRPGGRRPRRARPTAAASVVSLGDARAAGSPARCDRTGTGPRRRPGPSAAGRADRLRRAATPSSVDRALGQVDAAGDETGERGLARPRRSGHHDQLARRRA